MNPASFYSPGKLMLTGEYLVLYGASSISLPLKLGQSMKVSVSSGKPILCWNSKARGKTWFMAEYSLPELACGDTNDFKIADNLRNILAAAMSLNPDFLRSEAKISIDSDLEFDRFWGLGSSSSLLVNIAQWSKTDPLELHFLTSPGSGYDVAVCNEGNPIIYRLIDGKPIYSGIDFNPPFSDRMVFAYLGKKMDSAQAVGFFKKNYKPVPADLDAIDQINQSILQCKDPAFFEELLLDHEKHLSRILKSLPVSELFFSDFPGVVKSLGAWGGDFALFFHKDPGFPMKPYLRKKGIKNFFTYEELIKP